MYIQTQADISLQQTDSIHERPAYLKYGGNLDVFWIAKFGLSELKRQNLANPFAIVKAF